jgi:hypothetical protein
MKGKKMQVVLLRREAIPSEESPHTARDKDQADDP